MSVLSVENLIYGYSKGTPFEKAALKDVTLSFDEGDIVAVIGHTGSGKSTLLQHLNGHFLPLGVALTYTKLLRLTHLKIIFYIPL